MLFFCLKPFQQQLGNWIGTTVVFPRGFVLTFRKSARENGIIAQVAVCRATTVEMNGSTFRSGLPDIAGMEHYRVEQDRGAGRTGDVICLCEVVSVERLLSRMCRTGQNAKGMRCVVYIVQVKDNGYVWGGVGDFTRSTADIAVPTATGGTIGIGATNSHRMFFRTQIRTHNRL